MAPNLSFFFFFFFFVFFSLLLTHSLSIPPPSSSSSSPSPSPSPTPTHLIQQTCNLTTHCTLCISTLQSDPHGVKANDIKTLSIVAIKSAISNSKTTSSYASRLAKKAVPPATSSVLAACVGRYADAGRALRSAIEALRDENYEYAYVHVAAAGEYVDECRRLLGKQETNLEELERKEEGLKDLCAVAFDIVSLLG